MKAMTIVYQLMFLNLLFMLTSLPIITLGASSKALTGCIRDMLQGELTSEARTFFSYFKKDFLKTSLAFLIILIGYGIVVFNFINVEKTGWILGVVQIPVLLQLLMIHSMISYVLLEWQLPLKKTIKVAWILGNRNIIRTVGLVFISYMLLKLGLRIPLILIFFYAAFVSLIQYYFCYNHIIKVKGENS